MDIDKEVETKLFFAAKYAKRKTGCIFRFEKYVSFVCKEIKFHTAQNKSPYV